MYITKPAVVQKCLTKKKDGKTVMLSDNELEETKKRVESNFSQQTETRLKLKDLRFKIDSLKKRMNEPRSSNDELEQELQELEKQYNTALYKDPNIYSNSVKSWHDSFLEHLKVRKYWNPKRGAVMAMDTL